MSSFVAYMHIGKLKFKLLNVDFSYLQHVDAAGKPFGETRGGIFYATIESSTGAAYDMLTEWMFSTKIMHNGYIRFFKQDGISKVFDLEFYDTHCINYSESFNSNNSQPMVTQLTFSAGIIRIRNLVKERPWKVSDLSTISLQAASEGSRSDHFIKFLLVDPNGEPIPSVSVKLILPDGKQRTETSDQDGVIEIKNIKPGECKIVSDWKGVTMDDTVIIE